MQHLTTLHEIAPKKPKRPFTIKKNWRLIDSVFFVHEQDVPLILVLKIFFSFKIYKLQ
jgi:hypothetical protein